MAIPYSRASSSERNHALSIYDVISLIKGQNILPRHREEVSTYCIEPVARFTVGWSPIAEIIMDIYHRIDHLALWIEFIVVFYISINVSVINKSWLPSLCFTVCVMPLIIYLIIRVVNGSY
jgi:hypothetical protein